MNALDLIIIALLLGNMILGWAFGLVRRVIAFAGLFAGLGAATLTSANTSAYISNSFGITSAMWAHIVTYTVVVTGAVILFEVLGAVYQRHIDNLVAPAFDRIAGVMTGVVVAAFEVTIVLIIGIGLVTTTLPAGYGTPTAFLTWREWFNTSLLAPHFYSLEPLTSAIFAMVLPSSVSSYFTQLIGH